MASNGRASAAVGAACLLLLCGGAPSLAGDYMLTVADDRSAACAESARRVQAWCEEQRRAGNVCRSDASWPIASARQVVEDLGRYFAGEEPTIGILLTSFVNGHVDFCGATERTAVEVGLAAIAARPAVKHEDALIAIVALRATSTTVDAIRRQLARGDLDGVARARLDRLAAAVESARTARRAAH